MMNGAWMKQDTIHEQNTRCHEQNMTALTCATIGTVRAIDAIQRHLHDATPTSDAIASLQAFIFHAFKVYRNSLSPPRNFCNDDLCTSSIEMDAHVGVKGLMLTTFAAAAVIQRLQARLKGSEMMAGSAFLDLKDRKCEVFDDAVLPDERQKRADLAYKALGYKCPAEIPRTPCGVM